MHQESMLNESRRLGWPLVFRDAVRWDCVELSFRPERYAGGFAWLIHDCGSVLVEASWDGEQIEMLAALYPEGRWYLARHSFTAATVDEVMEFLKALREGKAEAA